MNLPLPWLEPGLLGWVFFPPKDSLALPFSPPMDLGIDCLDSARLMTVVNVEFSLVGLLGELGV